MRDSRNPQISAPLPANFKMRRQNFRRASKIINPNNKLIGASPLTKCSNIVT